MEQPLFSVILRLLTARQLLPDALDSIFLQRVPDVQVIVIDDGSN